MKQRKRRHAQLYGDAGQQKFAGVIDPSLFIPVRQFGRLQLHAWQCHPQAVSRHIGQLKSGIEQLVRVDPKKDTGGKRGCAHEVVAPVQVEREQMQSDHEGGPKHGDGETGQADVAKQYDGRDRRSLSVAAALHQFQYDRIHEPHVKSRYRQNVRDAVALKRHVDVLLQISFFAEQQARQQRKGFPVHIGRDAVEEARFAHRQSIQQPEAQCSRLRAKAGYLTEAADIPPFQIKRVIEAAEIAASVRSSHRPRKVADPSGQRTDSQSGFFRCIQPHQHLFLRRPHHQIPAVCLEGSVDDKPFEGLHCTTGLL